MTAAVVTFGCGTGDSRESVLTDLADGVIMPSYEQLVIDMDSLDAAADDLCREPTSDALTTARQALADARYQWSFTEPMWVGPVMERRSWAKIDWPIDPVGIDGLIADASIELDQERLSRRIGADERGLGAIDYILGVGDEPLAGFDQRRCQYLTGITEVAATQAALLPDDWAISFEDGAAYREIFAEVDGGGLDATVNGALFLLEAMGDAELGSALGAMENPPDPEAIVEGPSGLASADLVAHLAGLRAVLVGDEDQPGLAPLLDDELVSRLTEQLTAADKAVANLGSPLRAEIADDPTDANAARATIKAIQITMATELVAELGVTIGFSDADGDSG